MMTNTQLIHDLVLAHCWPSTVAHEQQVLCQCVKILNGNAPLLQVSKKILFSSKSF